MPESYSIVYKVLGGVTVDNEDGMFTCVEFKTELGEDLSAMLAK